jgi:hypothetical protein
LGRVDSRELIAFSDSRLCSLDFLPGCHCLACPAVSSALKGQSYVSPGQVRPRTPPWGCSAIHSPAEQHTRCTGKTLPRPNRRGSISDSITRPLYTGRSPRPMIGDGLLTQGGASTRGLAFSCPGLNYCRPGWGCGGLCRLSANSYKYNICRHLKTPFLKLA